jgi:G protein-coupled receptor 107
MLPFSQITVPFQYEWLDEMFREMATYVFFVLTGYKFRPASANPYFQVQDDDDDEEVDIV